MTDSIEKALDEDINSIEERANETIFPEIQLP